MAKNVSFLAKTEHSIDQPCYVGFQVGGFELGLLPQGQPAAIGPLSTRSSPSISTLIVDVMGDFL